MLSRMFETVRSGALLLPIIADAEMILCYSIRVVDTAVQVFGKIPILDASLSTQGGIHATRKVLSCETLMNIGMSRCNYVPVL